MGEEMILYMKSEIEKIMVIGIGGNEKEGIYEIIMRIVKMNEMKIS